MGFKFSKEIQVTEKIKSNVYRGLFLKETNNAWVQVNLLLSQSNLTCYLNGKVDGSIHIDHYTFITIEDAQLHEFAIIFILNNQILSWRFRALNLCEMTEWIYALCVSKRPTLKVSVNCHDCENKFTKSKILNHCRFCGKYLCKACSTYKANLEIMGYRDKQVICKDCINNVRTVKKLQAFTKHKINERVVNRLKRSISIDGADMKASTQVVRRLSFN